MCHSKSVIDANYVLTPLLLRKACPYSKMHGKRKRLTRTSMYKQPFKSPLFSVAKYPLFVPGYTRIAQVLFCRFWLSHCDLSCIYRKNHNSFLFPCIAHFPVLWRLFLEQRQISKYSLISFILADCFTLNGHLPSQYPQLVQSPACRERFR